MRKEYDYKGYVMTHTGKGRGRWYVKGAGIEGPKFFYSPHKAKSYIDAVIKQNKKNNNETDKAYGDSIFGAIFIVIVILLAISIFR